MSELQNSKPYSLASEADFFSNASNFQSAVMGKVDPRTGLFNYLIPIANLVGNNKLGPKQTISLSYNPLNINNIGFGTGFSIGLTLYDKKRHFLILSTGERYKVDESKNAVFLKKYKQDVVRFEKDVANNIYRVIHKSGLIEILSGPQNAFDIKVPIQLIDPFGNYLKFDWEYEVEKMPRLTGISDEDNKLLNISYEKDVYTEITIWPGSSEESKIKLIFYNEKMRAC